MGIADARSAWRYSLVRAVSEQKNADIPRRRTIARPTVKMKKLAINHPCRTSNQQLHLTPYERLIRHTQTIPTGPAGIEKDRVDAIEGNSPIILNAMAKTCTVE